MKIRYIVKPNSEGIIGGDKFFVDDFGLRVPKKIIDIKMLIKS